MSPGATFERVYNDLKRMLAEGELPPGSPIEPALIGKQIASSITPIRDALHRLTGERLVEAPNHNGFRVPLPTETALRDLYGWNAQLLGLAARRTLVSAQRLDVIGIRPDPNVAAATANFFVKITRATGSAEHVHAIQQLNDRLAPFRRAEEEQFRDVLDEFNDLVQCARDAKQGALAQKLRGYHRRRLRAAPVLLRVITANK